MEINKKQTKKGNWLMACCSQGRKYKTFLDGALVHLLNKRGLMAWSEKYIIPVRTYVIQSCGLEPATRGSTLIQIV